jgi:hypothetical protein
MDWANQDFRRLVDQAGTADLQRRSGGTKLTNQQLLFHMFFGYQIVRALLPLVRLYGRLSGRASTTMAWLLDSALGPFHVINYLGSCAGARIMPCAHLPGMLERVNAAFLRRLQQETETDLGRGMHFPRTWNPYFTDCITLADFYRYPTRHYQHRRQRLTLALTLPTVPASG